MPIVVNKSQQVTKAGTYPRSAYSRIVGVSMALPADSTWHYILTQPMGDRVWLLNVDVWIATKAVNIAQATLFDLYVGSGDPGTPAALRRWDGIVPIFDHNNARWAWTASDGSSHFHWTLSRFFKGEARRFGVAGLRPLAMGDDQIQVSFEICEG